jgi:hypothetical protein
VEEEEEERGTSGSTGPHPPPRVIKMNLLAKISIITT